MILGYASKNMNGNVTLPVKVSVANPIPAPPRREKKYIGFRLIEYGPEVMSSEFV
jgi:hypothetical protein